MAETGAEVRATDTTARLPLESQQLASTSDIASAPWPDASATDDCDEQDWLAVFATESVDEPVPATLMSAPVVPVHRVDQSASRGFAVVLWSRSAFVRLVAASVAAFVAGAVSVLWGLHALHSPSTADVDQTVASPSSAGVVSVSEWTRFGSRRRSSKQGSHPRRFGISIRWRSFHRNSSSRARRGRLRRTARAVRCRSVPRGRLEPPRSERSRLRVRHARHHARSQGLRSAQIALPQQGTTTRLVTVPGGSGEELLPETTRVPAGADPALAPNPKARSTAAAEEYAVRRTLHSYEEAYEGLDVAATAAVWPSVDRRALSRAFDTLKSQGLDFQSCVISVADSRATANCRGTLQFVRKVGNSAPLTADQQWVFKMRRLGAEWKIDEVSASQTPLLAAQRIRGEE